MTRAEYSGAEIDVAPSGAVAGIMAGTIAPTPAPQRATNTPPWGKKSA